MMNIWMKAMTTNRLLSLDQATKVCGYAVFEKDVLIESGTFEADKNEKNPITRIEQIYLQVYKKKKEYGIKYFVFEDTFNTMNIQVTKTLCWLQGAIMQMAFIEDCGFIMYMPSSWRKQLGFKTKSKKTNPQPKFKTNRDYQKHQAVEYVNGELGLNLSYKEDDRAEAICIGLAHIKKTDK